jgi:hypothetical protein
MRGNSTWTGRHWLGVDRHMGHAPATSQTGEPLAVYVQGTSKFGLRGMKTQVKQGAVRSL